MSNEEYTPVLCLDFDGVLHWYRFGWTGIDNIADLPVPGAIEFVQEAQKIFKVVVYSSRSRCPEGIEAMRAWLRTHGFPPMELVTEKPAAFVTIDDRAICFDGTFPEPKELARFTPWNKREAVT